MTTIRLTPAPVDIDVNVNEHDILSLFDGNLTFTIENRVREASREFAVEAATLKAEEVVTSREYRRTVRDWVMESMDMYELAREIAGNISVTEIAEAIAPDGNIEDNSRLLKALIESNQVKTRLEFFVTEQLHSGYFTAIIESAVDKRMTNIVNDVTERCMTAIAQRLAGGSDV
jgi:predicted RND superfamily exporter protein